MFGGWSAAVLLAGAVGFVGEGAFDKAGGESGINVMIAKVRSVFQPQMNQDFRISKRTH